MTGLLTVTDLRVQFRSGRTTTPAVRGIDFTVHPGAVAVGGAEALPAHLLREPAILLMQALAEAGAEHPAQQHCPLRLRAGASPSRRAADQHQRAVRRDAAARPPLPCFTFLLQRGVPRSERRIGNPLS